MEPRISFWGSGDTAEGNCFETLQIISHAVLCASPDNFPCPLAVPNHISLAEPSVPCSEPLLCPISAPCNCSPSSEYPYHILGASSRCHSSATSVSRPLPRLKDSQSLLFLPHRHRLSNLQFNSPIMEIRYASLTAQY